MQARQRQIWCCQTKTACASKTLASLSQQDADRRTHHRRCTDASPPESGIEHRKLKGIYGSLDVIVIAGRAVVFPAVDILRAQGGGWPHFDFAAGFMPTDCTHRKQAVEWVGGITAWAKRRPILLFSSDAAGRTPPLPMPCKAPKHCAESPSNTPSSPDSLRTSDWRG